MTFEEELELAKWKLLYKNTSEELEGMRREVTRKKSGPELIGTMTATGVLGFTDLNTGKEYVEVERHEDMVRDMTARVKRLEHFRDWAIREIQSWQNSHDGLWEARGNLIEQWEADYKEDGGE